MSQAVQPVHTNRLAKETSPYLLQHQHNPVDWYPWGPEAFERARREDKPIFLSVGYSTCYWCHVMERQSFENEAVAREMNERFVNIKVDREERPDVDQLYMTAVQVLTRHGGWPMSVWLTPDLRPFYGGTYYPPTDTQGRPGFVSLLRALDEAWQNRRDEVERTASQLHDILRQLAEPTPPSESITIDDAWVTKLVDRSTRDFDPRHGGFGGAPKFPRQTLLELLLVHNHIEPSTTRMNMIRQTLDALAMGGIRDHLGGGFHRYSVDSRWLVPHFEIMLYDNAMLAWCYIEAYRQTEDRHYATVARGIFDFVLREMTSPEGAFYTAMDAEVDAREGGSYLWTRDEVERLLESDDARLFCQVYGLDQGPNFEDPHHGSGRPESNVLFMPRPLATIAAEMGIDEQELEARLEPMRRKLKAARDQRKQPLLDTKILTSWNALMIRALACGGRRLSEQRYLDAAARAARWLLKHHMNRDGDLFRTSRDGQVKHRGCLDDYAFLAQAMLELYNAGAHEDWQEQAQTLARTMQRTFEDPRKGGFYYTDQRADDILVRQKVAHDSPLPSGNAVAAMVLTELGDLESARRVLAAFAQQTQNQSEGMSAMVEAYAQLLRRHEPFTIRPGARDAGSAERPPSPEQTAMQAVRLSGRWNGPRELLVTAEIAPPFHIAAHEAAAGMMATQLVVAGEAADAVATIDYPPAVERTLAFADAPQRLYEGTIAIAIRFTRDIDPGEDVRVAMRYQACDDTACLPPVTQEAELS